MEDKGSKRVLDFYLEVNNNKYELIKTNKTGRVLSKAELVVLSCMEVIARETEYSKLPYLESDDYDKIIKVLLISSYGDSINLLVNNKEYKELLDGYNNLKYDECYKAREVYSCMEGNFVNYQHPIYIEEKFVYENIKLQETIRKGHIYWGVKGNRLESILEHIYGCCALAIGIESEYGYSINYSKLIKMLLIHEMGEISVGDLTEWDISKEERIAKEREGVVKLLSMFNSNDKLMELYDEFNKNETLTAEFANLIDKLEYDMQVKVYDMKGMYNFANYPHNVVTQSQEVKNIIENGAESVFYVHYEFDKKRYKKYCI